MQGRKHYQEQLFTCFQLSDRVPADNFYRRLNQQLDLQFLYKATASYYGTEGQQSIDPVVFFKLMLIGYLENLSSDRRIISTVSLRLDLLLFLGYTLDEPLPWHSTLSRTRQLYDQEVFIFLFQQVLNQCIAKGMVAGSRQAIDSALVKANASMDSLVEKQVLADVKSFSDELEANAETVSARQKKKVEMHHSWKRKTFDTPGANNQKAKLFSNHTHYSATDPDAKVAVKPGKARQLNYLSQVAVDTAHHVITAVQAHTADKRDSQCLEQVVEQTLANLKPEGLVVEEVLADTGYSSGTALKALEENNITGYIPSFGQFKSEREGFTYHAQQDYYSCSQGKKLLYKKTYTDLNGYTKKQYRTTRHDCKGCPLRESCLKKAQERKIEDTIDKPYYERMHQRMQTKKAKHMMKIRQCTVEPVLGTLINFLGLRRVNTRGLKAANKCMLMAAVAYNLKKLLKFRTTKVISRVIALSKDVVSTEVTIFRSFLTFQWT